MTDLEAWTPEKIKALAVDLHGKARGSHMRLLNEMRRIDPLFAVSDRVGLNLIGRWVRDERKPNVRNRQILNQIQGNREMLAADERACKEVFRE